MHTLSPAMSSLAAARADNFWYPPNYDGKSSLAQVCLGVNVCWPARCMAPPPPPPPGLADSPHSSLHFLTTVMMVRFLWTHAGMPADHGAAPAARPRAEAGPGHPHHPLRDALQLLVHTAVPLKTPCPCADYA